MDVDTIKTYLVEAVRDAFNKTLSEYPEDLYSEDFNEIEEECVISSVSFKGLLEGSCTLALPASCACALVSRMMEVDRIDEITYDVIDGVGEIVNMIIGGVKMMIDDPKYYFDISVPTCVKGSRMIVLTGVKEACSVSRSFKVDDVCFAVSLLYIVKSSEDEKEKIKQAALDKLKMLKS